MKKIITFGEIMLRLKSPGYERLFQSSILESTFGGGEANVAVSLSVLGMNSSYVTVLPSNSIGNACLNELRKYGVDTKNIIFKEGRLGIYFLEAGSCNRPSVVVYDRDESCIAKATCADFDWDTIFSDGTWFHITGITPAISQNAADFSLEAVRKAKEKGLTVSVDLNYRKKLWKYGKKASEVMKEIVKYADVLIANEEDIQKSLNINCPVDVTKGSLQIEDYKLLAETVKNQFPNLNIVAITLRESLSADKNGWSGVLLGNTGFYVSKKYQIEDIVDRVGAGDSFSAGLIFGLNEYSTDSDCEQKALDFAVAASCLKHTISGDFNLVQKNEVLSLMGGNSSGRVQR